MVKTDQAVSRICLRLVISNCKTVTKTVTHVECARRPGGDEDVQPGRAELDRGQGRAGPGPLTPD